jgi:hypothetical protein
MTIGRNGLVIACALLALAAPVAAGADTGLVAQWNFDEPSGQTAFDAGPNGLNGRLGTLDTPDAADPERLPGGALRFDGSSTVEIPASPLLTLQRMTVEATVRAPSSPGTYRYVISRGGRSCYSAVWGLYTASTGGMAFYVFDGSRYYLSPTARASDVWDGAWHHIAGTFDGSALRLYVDGRQVGDPFPAPVTVDYTNTAQRAAIGQYAGTCELGYEGDLDRVAISRQAKTAAQVAADARGDVTLPPTAPATPLPPAAGGTTLPGPGSPRVTPPAKATCTIKLSRTRVVAHRRTVVRASVGLRKVKLVARRTLRSKPVASARTDARGRARLVVKAPRTGSLTVRVSGRSGCTPARLRVVAR